MKSTMPAARAHVFVRGYVQGVYFRAETSNLARRLGLSGWVRNLWDGRVEAVFEGGVGEVARMIEWCQRGPADASVEEVEVRYEPATGEFLGFQIAG